LRWPKVSGRSIFADIVQSTDEESLLDLAKSQYEFKQVVEPFLFEGLEFSDLGIQPVRWWPLPHSRRVVIDPDLLLRAAHHLAGILPSAGFRRSR